MTPVHYVPTGVANLASVTAAFARLDCELVPATEATAIATAQRLLLPGVGQFGAACQRLQAAGMMQALRERLERGAPTLAICLGMQLCADGSDEAPQHRGLGVLQGRLQRFPPTVRCPQMGWNAVAAPADTRLLRNGHAYFANSYRLAAAPAGWHAATAEHGGSFVAALERGAVLLCQFHPELSGSYGQELLARWLACAGDAPC
jgi:glutamine amidotransferase